MSESLDHTASLAELNAGERTANEHSKALQLPVCRRVLRLPAGRLVVTSKVMRSPKPQSRHPIRAHSMLSLVVSGCGSFRDDSGHYQLRPGDAYWWRRGVPVSVYRDDAPRWVECRLRLASGLERLLQPLGLIAAEHSHRPGPGLAAQRLTAFSTLHQAMSTTVSDAAVVAEIQRYLATVLPALPQADPLHQAMRQLESHLSHQLDIHAVARDLGVSAGHFRRIFRQRYGCSPREWRHRSRIERAKELLSEDELQVQAAAEALGYASAYSFSRQFKQLTGVAPSQWAQHVQSQSGTTDSTTSQLTR